MPQTGSESGLGGALLAAEHLSVSYRGEAALDDVSMRLERGDFLTIVGPNGAGKTTLLKCLIGVLKPDSGIIRRAPALKIGYAPQQLAADRTMPITAGGFLALRKHAAAKECARAAAEVNIGAALHKPLHALSGGELQRILLARALLGEPDVLVLDEPAQNLDVAGRTSFYALLASIYERRRLAIVMVSHDLHLVMRATTRVICLYRHICCSGAPQQVVQDPQFAAILGDAPLTAVYHHDIRHHNHHHGESQT
ncbi:MAG: metal ABC transporter ATP-binding protein [Gammaproteobacteria bacterium]